MASRARNRLGATSVHTRGLALSLTLTSLLAFHVHAFSPFSLHFESRGALPKSYRARIRSLYFHSVYTVTTCKIYLYILFMSHTATHVHVYAYILCMYLQDNKSSSRQRRTMCIVYIKHLAAALIFDKRRDKGIGTMLDVIFLYLDRVSSDFTAKFQ